MATSGSTNFTQTRNEIVYDALQLIGVYGVGKTISAEDMNFSVNILNKMIKSWEGKDIHLWKMVEGVLMFTDSLIVY